MADNPRGISFPFRFSDAGGVRESEGVNKVKDNLIALVLTAINERLIRKKVGTIGYTRLLRNHNAAIFSMIRGVVREAFSRYESRAFITNINIYSEDERDGNKVLLEVDFIFRQTGDQGSLTTQLA